MGDAHCSRQPLLEEVLPRCLLPTSWHPREVSEIPRDTNLKKIHPRRGCQGLSRCLWHAKAEVGVKFLYSSKTGWLLPPVLTTLKSMTERFPLSLC